MLAYFLSATLRVVDTTRYLEYIRTNLLSHDSIRNRRIGDFDVWWSGYKWTKNLTTITLVWRNKAISSRDGFFIAHYCVNRRIIIHLRPILIVSTQYIMLIINVKEEESIDRALKRYKRKFQRTGLLKEIRRRKNFVKPSVQRRNEILNAEYREKNYGG